MLDALLIAGLVSAIATPVYIFVVDYAKSIDVAVLRSSTPKVNSPSPVSPLQEEIPREATAKSGAEEKVRSISKADCDDLDSGVIHEVPVDVSEIIVSAFRPGIDCCRVWLRNPNVEFDSWTSAAGAVLTFHDADECLTIVFQGLSHLPFEDIETIVDCPKMKRQSKPLASRAGSNGSKENIKDAEWCLAAWAETEQAVEAFDDPDSANAEMRRGPRLPEFTGFDADSEYIEVWVPGTKDSDVPVEVLSSYDGQHGLVFVGGHPAVLLQGAPSASLRNIRLIPKSSKAA